MKISSHLAGVAGEYFVAAELSRRGLIASISLRNTRGIDILATNNEASRTITIQCKTNQEGKKRWILNEKNETYVSDSHFFVFVALAEINQRPSYYIVPSKIVADNIRSSHKTWLDKKAQKGGRHVDNPVRIFSDPEDKFRDRWDYLGL